MPRRRSRPVQRWNRPHAPASRGAAPTTDSTWQCSELIISQGESWIGTSATRHHGRPTLSINLTITLTIALTITLTITLTLTVSTGPLSRQPRTRTRPRPPTHRHPPTRPHPSHYGGYEWFYALGTDGTYYYMYVSGWSDDAGNTYTQWYVSATLGSTAVNWFGTYYGHPEYTADWAVWDGTQWTYQPLVASTSLGGSCPHPWRPARP